MVSAYDRVRYPSLTFAATNPVSTGALAALFGRPFVPFARSRVLEIGCGEGVNLINLALISPQAQFVGVDLSTDAIARARAMAESCGSANVSFHARDLIEVDAAFGRFDYILAHGVYAWVSPPVRQAVFRVIGERLSADGLALVSYNVQPGSRLRQALRDMLFYLIKDIEDPAAKLKVARSFLTEQIEVWSDTQADESAVKGEARRMLDHPIEVLYHDELAEDYAPELLTDVVEAAARFGLTYFCDAQPALSEPILFPSDAFTALRERAGGDWVRIEQLTDFRTLRRFRYSIFGLGRVDRRWDAARLRGLVACGEMTVVRADPEVEDGAAFEAGRIKIRTNDPTLAQFLAKLAEAFPLCLPLEPVAQTPSLGDRILRLFAREAIELYTAPPPLVAVPGERPVASPLARLQAANGESLLATLRHTMIQIDDPSVRALVPLIDGGRTRAELADEIVRRNDVSRAEASEQLDEILAKFARAGLMTS
jgi:SAM-dependent methyltransferase